MEGLSSAGKTPESQGTPESIASAAVVFNGMTFTGINHALAIMQLEKKYPRWQSMSAESVEEGFLTSTGRFVDRHEAGEIAERAYQLAHLDAKEKGDATEELDSYHLKH